jgi:hypothetical protein
VDGVVGTTSATQGLSGVRITSVRVRFLNASPSGVRAFAGGEIQPVKITSATSPTLDSEVDSSAAAASMPASNSSSIAVSSAIRCLCAYSSTFSYLSASLIAASAPVSIRLVVLS